jgi:hypothetical protein
MWKTKKRSAMLDLEIKEEIADPEEDHNIIDLDDNIEEYEERIKEVVKIAEKEIFEMQDNNIVMDIKPIRERHVNQEDNLIELEPGMRGRDKKKRKPRKALSEKQLNALKKGREKSIRVRKEKALKRKMEKQERNKELRTKYTEKMKKEISINKEAKNRAKEDRIMRTVMKCMVAFDKAKQQRKKKQGLKSKQEKTRINHKSQSYSNTPHPNRNVPARFQPPPPVKQSIWDDCFR